ncbi:MAG: histidinol phosphate phosphatase domain-containing protein [Methanoregula sp.]|jgi:histidinol phosphatase-like PHP family hydrolase|nr:histidinol phosphate phosphatase domain-containing protein [Methanoregula sp.]
MYDLHTHSILSDGEMLPTELIRRMAVAGYTTVAITDHVDLSNAGSVLATLARVRESAKLYGVRLLCGVEITHVPPAQIAGLAKSAKSSGADIVVVHGETPVEPVAEGTNHAACSCKHVNVLAHPGLVTLRDARLAEENGIALEITSRGGHNRTNGHVARIAHQAGCRLVVDSDAHAPHDILDKRAKFLVAKGAGLTDAECKEVLSLNIDRFLRS